MPAFVKSFTAEERAWFGITDALVAGTVPEGMDCRGRTVNMICAEAEIMLQPSLTASSMLGPPVRCPPSHYRHVAPCDSKKMMKRDRERASVERCP
jgi:hypothetical protein